MQGLKYSSQIKDMGLLAKEMKIACVEYLKVEDFSVIIDKSINDNIFFVNTERRRKELAYKLVYRLSAIDEFIIESIAKGSYNNAAILSLYALMKTERLVFEFMYEIVKDKIQLLDYKLTDVELNHFLVYKSQQDEVVAGWKDSNKIQVKSALRKILVDAGIVKDLGSTFLIMPPIVERSIVDHIIKSGDKVYLESMGVIL